jgi:hypothetical protein
MRYNYILINNKNMKVKLKKYTNIDLYEKDYPEEIEVIDQTVKALDIARSGVSRIRRARRKDTSLWVGYKIFNLNGDLLYKLPL